MRRESHDVGGVTEELRTYGTARRTGALHGLARATRPLRGPRALTIGPIVGFLLLWEVAARTGLVNDLFFPSPSKIARAGADLVEDGVLLSATWATFRRLAIGFALGAVPAVVVGIVMGYVRPVRTLLRPIISITYPLPKSALLPLLILVLGIGERTRYAIVALGVFFPVLTNSVAGVLSIPAVYTNVGRNFGARGARSFFTIALPGALPHVFTGLRIGINTALIVVVTVEMLFSNTGLGYLIWNSWQIFFVEQMYVSLTMVGLLGYAITVFTDQVEKRAIAWQPRVTSY